VALFQQGRDLVKQGRYAEACPKLAESQRLEPKLGTLLNLAVCNEKLGKTATAWAEYASAAAMARREGAREQEREAFARDQAAALEKTLARVTFRATAPEPGIRLTLDDQPLADAVLGTPLPIDPGKHRLSVGAAGKKAWSTVFEVPAEKADVDVPIPSLEAAPAEPPPPPPVIAPVQTPPLTARPAVAPVTLAVAPAPSGPSTATVLMGVGFGVGAAGVLVGAVTGAVTLANAGSIRSKCTNNQCGSDQQSAIDGANTLANVSNVSFGFGAAGIVVGVVGVLLRPGPKAATTGLHLTPLVGPGTVALGGSF
jgi:hypothetical protein